MIPNDVKDPGRRIHQHITSSEMIIRLKQDFSKPGSSAQVKCTIIGEDSHVKEKKTAIQRSRGELGWM